MRASDADREHVVEILTAAFVQGRLTIEELCLRAGQALASRTYAELAVTIADIPAPPFRAPPAPGSARPPAPALFRAPCSAGPPAPAPSRAPVPPARMPASAKAAVWTACAIVAAPAVWAAFLTYYGRFLVLFLLAFTGLTVTIGTQVDKRAAG